MTGQILLVDAVPINRMVLRVRLATACYKVAQAATGAAALDAATRMHPDLIVLDPALPDIDGLELCRRLKAAPETAEIPLIMITAGHDKSARMRALQAGADEFLAKPLDELTLLARVRSLLRARDAERELALREGTWRELGFAEPVASFTSPGRVVLVGAHAGALSEALAPLMPDDRVTALTREQTLAGFDTARSPDVFVLAEGPGNADALALLSDLRSRPTTRTAVVIVLLAERAGRGAMALDLGANDIVIGEVDLPELALRLRTQLARKRHSDRLRASVSDGLRMAVTDPLTGLFNRRYALNHLPRMLRQAALQDHRLALLVIDADRFKQINDGYGHRTGDRVLAKIAAQLRANLRDVDMIARIGGDEFVVALPESTATTALAAAERLRAEVARECVAPLHESRAHQAAPVPLSISLGVALGNAAGTSIEALIHAADVALYRAKAGGGNRAEIAPEPPYGAGRRDRACRLAPRLRARSRRLA